MVHHSPVDINSPSEDEPPTVLGVFDAEARSDELIQVAVAGDNSSATVALPPFVMSAILNEGDDQGTTY